MWNSEQCSLYPCTVAHSSHILIQTCVHSRSHTHPITSANVLHIVSLFIYGYHLSCSLPLSISTKLLTCSIKIFLTHTQYINLRVLDSVHLNAFFHLQLLPPPLLLLRACVCRFGISFACATKKKTATTTNSIRLKLTLYMCNVVCFSISKDFLEMKKAD